MSFWDSRTKGALSRSRPALPQVVRDAEEILLSALAPELLRACDQAEVAVQAAFREWRSAYSELAVAQRGGDPRAIVEAQVFLEQALELAQERSVARDRIRQVVSDSRVQLPLSPRGSGMVDVIQDAHQGAPEFAVGIAGLPERPGWWRPARRRLGLMLRLSTPRSSQGVSAGEERERALDDQL